VFADDCETFQQTLGEFPTNDRRKLQSLLWGFQQPIDARHQHILDGIGGDKLFQRLGQHLMFTLPPQSAHALEGLDHFFDKEEVSFNLLHNQGLHRLGKIRRSQHGPDHLYRVRRGRDVPRG
jgi:hypothetical protein